MLNSTSSWWFLSHSVRGSIVCRTEVFAAELWFLWINWRSGHIHGVFCRQAQVCLAHAPSPSGHRSALAQKLRNWCWAGARYAFPNGQVRQSRLRVLLQPLRGVCLLQILGWISLFFCLWRPGWDWIAKPCCAGDEEWWGGLQLWPVLGTH